MTIRSLIAVLIVGQMFCGALAQQSGTGRSSPPPAVSPQPQKPDEDDVVKITTNLVQVDAIVTDKSGKIVTDLKPEEFEISEDGKRQQITHFSYNSAPVSGARSNSPAANQVPDKDAPIVPPRNLTRDDVRRSVAIVVDDLGMSFESISYVRNALKKFVAEQMQPGDLVSIIRTAGGVSALQQFSADKRQLNAAIDHLRWYPLGRGDVSPTSPLGAPGLKLPGMADRSNAESQDAFREEVFSIGTIGTLHHVVRGLHDLPGRKSILFISDGLKIMVADRIRLLEALRALTDEANRASVVIYTMDARGVQTLGLDAADNTRLLSPMGARMDKLGLGRSMTEAEQQVMARHNSFFESQNGLHYLAEQTGGIAVLNTNNLSGGIQRVIDDQRGYYLIGYRPEESTFDPKSGRRTFHHLSLKVTRPGKYQVRMRNGFFGRPDEARKAEEKTAAQQLLDALSSPFGATDIRLQLTSLFANDAANGSYMRSLLHIEAKDLTFKEATAGGHEAVFDLVAMTFGDTGTAVDYTAQTYTLQLPEEHYQRALRQGLVYNVTVPIKKAGAYHFRIALRDTATGHIGSASQYIEVPDLNNQRLALSGVVLSDSKAGAVDNAKPGAELNDPAASPAVRDFRQGAQLEWGYLIYNAQLDKQTQRPQLTTSVRLFRDGQMVFSGSELPLAIDRQKDLQRLPVSGAVILGTDLTPGEYILQVRVTDTLAEKKYRTATQWMDFQIVK